MKRLIIAAMLLLPMRAFALNTNDLLSVIAMPLAVAAVSDITGVPVNELSNFVATLNNANVPAPQVIELIRYVPVALVQDSTQQQTVFVDYVQSQVAQGVTGVALVPVIVERLRTYDLQPEVVTFTTTQAAPVRRIVVDSTYIPPAVRTRIETIRTHPHGGPPGQLKKAAGVQTGAEIVHGMKPGNEPARAVAIGEQPGKEKKRMPPQPMISSSPQKGTPPGQAKTPPGQMKKMEHGNEQGGEGHDKKH